MSPSSPPDHSNLNTLIIVCCHAIWLGGPTAGVDESEWAIEPFQSGDIPTLTAHAEAGISELVKANGSAMLVISGGVTKRAITPLSEAESYHNLIKARTFLPETHGHLASLIRLETRSVDSFHNLLFPLLLFSDETGRPPSSIVIVTHAFKANRFLELHCRTCRVPQSRVRVRGIDPPGHDTPGVDVWLGTAPDPAGLGLPSPKLGRRGREVNEAGERRAVEAWREDWWGWGPVLGPKRLKRGWEDEEGLHEVVYWRGGESLKEDYPGRLPWEYDDAVVKR